ncbi:MAG: helix-turn-helix transcriptional regulator [Elusimicrobia bacterium]|nr:helix-turn-helix transcriptional regulator [Elusimicrobiota bacterium]
MNTDFAQQLRRLRTARGWSQRELARRSGVPAGHISQIESGHIKSPGLTTALKLSVALGIKKGLLDGRAA